MVETQMVEFQAFGISAQFRYTYVSFKVEKLASIATNLRT